MQYKKLDISKLGLEKDFVTYIDKYQMLYESIYKSTTVKKKRKRLFDKFFFSMD